MALKLIGAGLGRTGTKSMQTALNILGLGPCHHMVEVFAHPESIPLWIEAGAGRGDWDKIFENYQSAVDYPSAHYWKQIAAHYPDAKVLLTERDADQWFDSTQATIFSPANEAMLTGDSPFAAFFASFASEIQPHLHDRAYMTAMFRRHVAEVKATIDPKRLLVYQVGEGWDRLCAFLGVPVPNEPYPSENSRQEFMGRQRDFQAQNS
jgi:hypothetical protein